MLRPHTHAYIMHMYCKYVRIYRCAIKLRKYLHTISTIKYINTFFISRPQLVCYLSRGLCLKAKEIFVEIVIEVEGNSFWPN